MRLSHCRCHCWRLDMKNRKKSELRISLEYQLVRGIKRSTHIFGLYIFGGNLIWLSMWGITVLNYTFPLFPCPKSVVLVVWSRQFCWHHVLRPQCFLVGTSETGNRDFHRMCYSSGTSDAAPYLTSSHSKQSSFYYPSVSVTRQLFQLTRCLNFPPCSHEHSSPHTVSCVCRWWKTGMQKFVFIFSFCHKMVIVKKKTLWVGEKIEGEKEFAVAFAEWFTRVTKQKGEVVVQDLWLSSVFSLPACLWSPVVFHGPCLSVLW